MPNNYTHYRFGKEVAALLPEAQRRCVGRFRRMYDMGLHGPDIFFYHSPFRKKRQGSLGELFHNMTGQEFFGAAFAAAEREAAQAYLYGLLAHYCLDSICHPYINQLVTIGEVRHIALESEWDRFFLQKDGIAEPHRYDMSKRFYLTRGECVSVCPFYPGSTPDGVRSSVRFMAFAARFFARGNRERRIRLLKHIKPEFCDFFLPTREEESMCLYVNALNQLYAQALENYPKLLAELLEKNGEALSEAFAPTFG